MGIASLSSHQRVLTRSVDDLRARVDAIGQAVAVDIRVNSGLQAGAAKRLSVNEITFGSETGNTLVLVDGAVAPRHLCVRLTHSIFGILADVEALGEGVTLSGAPLQPGAQRTSCKLPLTLGIAGNEIEIARPSGTRLSGTAAKAGAGMALVRQRLPSDPVLLFACLALVVLMLAAVLFTALPSGRDFAVAVNTPQQSLADSAAAQRDWPGLLQRRLEDAGLETSLHLSDREAGLIMVEGYLRDAQLDSFRNLQTWVDAQPDTPAIVWNVQRRSPPAPLPAIGMVRLSEPPALVLARGKVIEVGDEIGGGWVLSDVTQTHFAMTRDGESQIVSHAQQ